MKETSNPVGRVAEETRTGFERDGRAENHHGADVAGGISILKRLAGDEEEKVKEVYGHGANRASGPFYVQEAKRPTSGDDFSD